MSIVNSKLSLLLSLGVLYVFPVLVLAQNNRTVDPAGNNRTVDPAGGPNSATVDPAGSGGVSSVRLQNPLENQTLMGLLMDILDVIMVFAVPIIVFFIIYAGFLYVTAQGNEETVKKAHRALLYSVVGGVIILGAQLLLSVISGTIASF